MKKILAIMLFFGLLLTLGGCFLEPAESLYAVPKQPESYTKLQSAIALVMTDGAAYAPPVAGENQQAVQMTDLDGDGADEAVVYLKTNGDAPLSICIFDTQGGQFVLTARIDGAGNAFDRVQYVEVDGALGNEIVVGRQVSDSVTQILGVYAYRDGTLLELMSATYSNFITTDLDSDGQRGVFLLHQNVDATNGTAEYYHWVDGQMIREREGDLSAPASAVKRIITGGLSQGIPAVFVTSAYGEADIVTDIFGFRDGIFSNLAPAEQNVVQTVRDYYVYCCDIDADGLIELPRIVAARTFTDDETSQNQSLIVWYNLLLNGTQREKHLTYHSYAGGWYVELPQEWERYTAVTRVKALGGILAYRFYYIESGVRRELFSLAAVSGETADSVISSNGWQKMAQKGETAYACLLGESAADYDLSVETLREMFRFIQVDWKTGETG